MSLAAGSAVETCPNHTSVPLILDSLCRQQQSRSGSMSAASATDEGSKRAYGSLPLSFRVAVKPMVEAMPG